MFAEEMQVYLCTGRVIETEDISVMSRWLRSEEEWWGRRQVMRLVGPADHPHRSEPPIQPPPATAGRTGVGAAADNKWMKSRNLCL